jgi:hypothetical protein
MRWDAAVDSLFLLTYIVTCICHTNHSRASLACGEHVSIIALTYSSPGDTDV